MRAPRERDGHASRQDVQDCQSPMGAASVPGTPVNGRYMRYGVFVLTIDGRRTGAPHGTLLASPRAAAPRRHMLYLRRYCHIICTIGHEVPPRIEVRLQDLHERGSVTAPALRAANTGSTGSTAAVDGPAQRGGGRRSRVDLLAAFARCVEIKIFRRVRAESSRRPPRHRRDARSMACVG